MRRLLAVTVVGLTALPALSLAQDQPGVVQAKRVLLSAGLGRSSRLTGGHLRAEYGLTSLSQTVGVRVHLGAFWTPTQAISVPSMLFGEGSRFEGMSQVAEVDVGLSGTLAPWPEARFSPYILAGVGAVQRWSQVQGAYLDPTGAPAWMPPPHSVTHGGLTPILGVGLRFLVTNHLLQLEARHYSNTATLGLGTTLPF